MVRSLALPVRRAARGSAVCRAVAQSQDVEEVGEVLFKTLLAIVDG